MDYNQILMLLLQFLIIATLLVTLFRLRNIFGLSLLFTTLGVFQFLQVFLSSSFYIEVYSAIIISTGSMLLFSGSLFTILMVYIREDALEARKIIYALFVTNMVLAFLLIVFSWSLDADNVNAVFKLPKQFYIENAHILFIGTLILLLDAFAIIFVYEFVSKYTKYLFLRILFTMTLVLGIDTLLFTLGIFGSSQKFQTLLISGLISKTFAAIIYSGLFTFYMIYFDKENVKIESESDNFKDIFHKLTFRQKYEDVLNKIKVKNNELIELQNIAQLGTFNLNFKSGIFTSSTVFDKIVGLNSSDEKSFMNWRKLVHPNDISGNQELLENSIATGKKFEKEYRIVTKRTKELKWIKGIGEIIYKDNEAFNFLGTIQDITERKQSEQALRQQNKELIVLSEKLSEKNKLILESQRKFKNLFDRSPVSLWEEDFSQVKQLLNKKLTEVNDLKKYLDENPDFVNECISKMKILNVNKVSLELLGVENRKELINHLSNNFNGDSYEVFKKELLSIATNKEEFSSQTEFIRSDGVTITTLIKFVVMGDNKDQAIVSIVDIDELNKVKQEIVKSEKRFRELYEKSGDAILILENGVYIDCNQATIDLFGYRTTKKILNKTPSQISPKLQADGQKSTDKATEMISEALKKGSHRFEWTHINRKGEEFPTEVLLTSISNELNNEVIHSVVRDISDRKRIKEQLIKSEEKFSKAYFNNPMPIFISSIPDGAFIDVNPMFEKISGRNREELIGKKVTDLGFYANEEDRFKLFEEIEKKGRLQGYEIGFNVKSGEVRDCLMYSEIIDIDGNPSLISIVSDITKQKKADIELKNQNEELIILGKDISDKNRLLTESQQKFKKLFDKNSVSLWEEDFSVVKKLLNKKIKETNNIEQYLDENPNFVQECISKLEIININDISLELLGYKNKKELLSQLNNIFTENSIDGFKRQLLAIAQNKNEFSTESELLRSDGKIINVLLKFVNISDEDDRAILSIIDITELNKAKEEIERSERQFRELYEKSGDAILIIKNGKFVECNQATVDMLEYNTKEAFLNSHPSKLSPIFQPNGQKSFDKAIEMMNLALKKGTQRFEWIHTKKNGENFPVEVLLTAIVNEPTSKIIHCVWRDITDRKEAELTLKESEKELQNSQNIAQLGTFNLDLKTNLFTSSPIFDRITGFKDNETKTLDVWQKITDPDDSIVNQKMLRDCIKTEIKFDREYKIINKTTKKLKWVHGMGEIINFKGKPTYFRGTIQDITQRKLSELTVKLNEQKLIEIQKIANLGTYELDLITNSITTSKIYNSILGRKNTPKRNRGWWKSITHPDDFERSERLWQQCIEDCTFYNDEYRILTDKNEIKWIHDIAEVKCDNGVAVGVVGTIQDITIRKLSEEKIKRSDAILSQVNSLVKVTDKNGNLTYASPSFKYVLGYETDEMLGQGWWRKTTGNIKSANKVRDEVLDVVKNKKILTNELKNRWIKTKDGQPKLFQWTCSKGLGDSLIFIGIDITEREEKEAQFKTLTETAHDAIILVDHKGLIFEWNKSSQETFGYTKEEIIGKSLTLLMPKKYREQYKKGFSGVMRSGLQKSYRNNIVEGLTKDDNVFPMELSINFWESSNRYVYCYFIRDITKRQREEHIKQVIFNITKKSNESISLGKLFNFIKTELGKLINTNNFFIALYNEKTDMISTPYMVDEKDNHDTFPKGETLTGHVIDSKKALLTNEVIMNFSGNKPKAIGIGPQSKCWLGVPLIVEKKAIGAIVVQSYTDEKAYSQEDVVLLELIAANIGQVIKKIDDLDQINLLNKALIQSPHAVMVTNKKGIIEYTNPAFTEISGYSETEAIGKTPNILKYSEQSPQFYKNLWNTISKGKTWEGEFINQRKDGKKYLVETNISSVKNNKGEITHYIGVQEDITQKRKLERQFINAFVEAQEIEKQNFGEELHDGISQILSAEAMYIDLLIEQNKDRINDKAKFLTKIKELNVSAIYETRSIAHGLMSNQLKKSGLIIAIENICIDYSSTKNIEFFFTKRNLVEKEISKVIKINMFRIVQEITTNVVRHSLAKQVTINLSKVDKNMLKLIVKDDGLGIDIEKNKKGTGLKNIERRVKLLNGNLNISTAPNKGTSFTIVVPLKSVQ